MANRYFPTVLKIVEDCLSLDAQKKLEDSSRWSTSTGFRLYIIKRGQRLETYAGTVQFRNCFPMWLCDVAMSQVESSYGEGLVRKIFYPRWRTLSLYRHNFKMPRFKKVTGLTNLTSLSVTAAQHYVGPQFPLHLLPEGPPQATTSATWCLALLCVKLPVRECEVSHLSSPINSLRLPCCKWSLPSEFRDVRTKQFVIFYEKVFWKKWLCTIFTTEIKVW